MPPLTRRAFLRLGAGVALAPLLRARAVRAADGVREYRLRAQVAKVRLADEPFPETELWCYDGRSPGPLLRLRQGEPCRIVLRNELPEPTTLHAHGVRLANAADGVPYLTQEPVAPGETYVYEFTPPDAGTFWYHSHFNSDEQLGRGLYGPLIVEEPEPQPFDREILWVLDDWRLTRDARIRDDFHREEDFARAGRLGNTITLNGRMPRPEPVRAGERVRLRILNACNARIFQLRFARHVPWVIAVDGQPCEPFQADGGITIAPAQRVDLMLDMTGEPGRGYGVLDTFYPQSPLRLTELAYAAEAPLRPGPPGDPVRLPPNPVPLPDLARARREFIDLEGGDMGEITNPRLYGAPQGLGRLLLMGKLWAINGIAGFRTVMAPLFTIRRGSHVLLHFRNFTAWPHPMHLHGHSFRVVHHEDAAAVGRMMDTVLVGPGEQAQVAFVADNPGDWLFHCHIVSHAEAGMIAVVRVT
ncbi:multicopper oxidase family protein [Inmirania thermothiophila]|uniref:FtsP/CotA-like multicopper oxidase with cupredoxin domain n=1 Tax=Inmirania thermothiophila TaxID=1750597 RepID=A0A3N1Y5M6_9GAMM|nr:multicopper oxidase family protein [Inmirania thermothiophila]ROR34114.1 FtsP/CotA-like multicopper oxidase with cupredoxin domain [Inmirania thermothiophila]